MTPTYTPPDWEEGWTWGEVLLVLMIPFAVLILVALVWVVETIW